MNNRNIPQNDDLAEAFIHIAKTRENLEDALERNQFHSDAWKQAFFHTLDQIESLKTATPRDAAVLGML